MKTILAALDFSDVTDLILKEASRLARTFGSRVYLVHVEAPDPDFVGYETGPQVVRTHVARTIITDHQKIVDIRDSLKNDGIDAHSLVIQGPTAEKIVEEALRVGAELIIVGSHDHGALHDLLFGSVSEGVMRHTPCPVLVVPCRVGES